MWLVWSPCSPRESQESYPTPQFKSISCLASNLLYNPTLTSIHKYWRNHSFYYMDLCWEINVSAFYTLCKFVIAFSPRSKCLLTSWLQSPSAVILEPKKIKPVPVSIVSSIICHDVMGPEAMILLFECWVLSQLFHSPLSPSPRGSLVPLSFLPWGWWCLHIWVYWYFSQQPWFQLVLHPAPHFAWCTCI